MRTKGINADKRDKMRMRTKGIKCGCGQKGLNADADKKDKMRMRQKG
jgi:hypothetical protein